MATIQLQDVKDRLTQLGYNATAQDDALLTYNIAKVTTHIKNQTNQYSIPSGAYYIAIDMVVGEFLFLKQSMGQLDGSGMNIGGDAPIQTIRDGDTTVTYAVDASSDGAANFSNFLRGLLNEDYDWGIWRRMRWC